MCQNLNIPIIPGVNNPSGVEEALSMGLETLKFFPAEVSGGVKMLKALGAPYNKVKFMCTGGITSKNIKEYLSLGNVIACGGSWNVEKSLVSNKNWEEIGKMTREVVELVK